MHFLQSIATACLFLAAKVEEQPRKLEHVIKVSHLCLHRETPDPKSEVRKTSNSIVHYIDDHTNELWRSYLVLKDWANFELFCCTSSEQV